MKEIFLYLKEARLSIDGRMQCYTPEYEALDSLERAIDLLAQKVQEIDNGLHRVSNEVSCRENGIIPD